MWNIYRIHMGYIRIHTKYRYRYYIFFAHQINFKIYKCRVGGDFSQAPMLFSQLFI